MRIQLRLYPDLIKEHALICEWLNAMPRDGRGIRYAPEVEKAMLEAAKRSDKAAKCPDASFLPRSAASSGHEDMSRVAQATNQASQAPTQSPSDAFAKRIKDLTF